MSRTSYPIILGGGKLKKGIIALPGKGRHGFDVIVVWLKKEVPSGEPFNLDDVEKAQSVLHFCDRKAVQIMKKTMDFILENWKEEGNDDYQHRD